MSEKYCVCACVCVCLCVRVCVCEREKPYSWVIIGQLLDHRGPMIDSLTTITLNLNVRERERGTTCFQQPPPPPSLCPLVKSVLLLLSCLPSSSLEPFSLLHHNCCIPSYCALAASDEKGLKALSNIHPDIKRREREEKKRRNRKREKIRKEKEEEKGKKK